MSDVKKQFIAGAECPACHAMDQVRMWYMDGVPHRECAACGYNDRLDSEAQPLGDDEPQPLRIIGGDEDDTEGKPHG